MDRWSKITEFLACGLLVLPIFLGLATGSFDVFALTLAPLLLALIGVTLGAPAVPAPSERKKDRPEDD